MGQRTALGLLFLFLAASFAGIAIAAASGALGGWLLTLAGRGLRRR